MKRVLVLGAGLVSRPLVHYLTDQPDLEVTLASRTVSKADALVAGRERGTAAALDVKDESALEKLVADHDLAVSLLPATEHVKVATLCLKHKKHMSTTSYISPEMTALSADAVAADLTFINECGVDPGIDHMSAMRIIHQAESEGSRVVSFRSYCGGLPAPEANTNPIGYKFSWAPRGVLVAATNPGRYLQDGQIVDVPGDELFANPERVTVPGAGEFEGYPNRDSMPYQEMYGLDDVKTMFRGTLRNLGHCESWYHWVKLRLFDASPRTDLGGLTYQGWMQGIAGGAPVEQALATKLGVGVDHPAITKLAWLGLFEDQPLPMSEGGNVDVMAARMRERCPLGPDERDLIVLQHEFVIEGPAGARQVHSTLIDFGNPGGDSAMARTVSLPVAIATRLILQGEVTERGVIAPIQPVVYNPILDELERLGIRCEERATGSPSGG
jgi:saccharopine dehydrogenase-like NADP-dependent oxidoreductase